MKKFVVMETSVATENNEKFKGRKIVSLTGKGGVVLIIEDFTQDENGKISSVRHEPLEFIKWWCKEYGYNRKGDAKRNWTYRNSENTEYWRSWSTVYDINL